MESSNNFVDFMNDSDAQLIRLSAMIDSPEMNTYPHVIRNGALVEVSQGCFECDCEVHQQYKEAKITKDDMSICDRYHVNYWEYLDKFKENHSNPNIMERAECITMKCDCVASLLKKAKSKKATAKVETVPEDVDVDQVSEEEKVIDDEPKPEVVVDKPKRTRKPKLVPCDEEDGCPDNVIPEEKPKRTRKPKKTTGDDDAKIETAVDQLEAELEKLKVDDVKAKGKGKGKGKGKNTVQAMLDAFDDE
jgi:hypothetical protein